MFREGVGAESTGCWLLSLANNAAQKDGGMLLSIAVRVHFFFIIIIIDNSWAITFAFSLYLSVRYLQRTNNVVPSVSTILKTQF